MKYAVILEPTATGFSAYIPDVPGCISTGSTRDETLSLLREGLEMHLELMRQDGDAIPQPTSIAEEVEIAV